jgi:hypothetical protein
VSIAHNRLICRTDRPVESDNDFFDLISSSITMSACCTCCYDKTIECNCFLSIKWTCVNITAISVCNHRHMFSNSPNQTLKIRAIVAFDSNNIRACDSGQRSDATAFSTTRPSSLTISANLWLGQRFANVIISCSVVTVAAFSLFKITSPSQNWLNFSRCTLLVEIPLPICQ